MGRDLRSKNSKAAGYPTDRGQATPSGGSSIANQAATSEDTAPNHKVVYPRSSNVFKVKGTPAKRRKIYDIYEDAEAVLRDDSSPLYDRVPLKNVLLHPKAVEALRDAGVEFSALTSDTLSSTVAQFKEDGGSGRYDSAWVFEAQEANVSRSSGATAAYEDEKFEEMWATENEELTDSEDGSDYPYGDDDDDDDDDSDGTPDDHRNESHETEMANTRDRDNEPRGALGDVGTTDPLRDALPNISSSRNVMALPGDGAINIWYAPRTQIKARVSVIKMDLLFSGPHRILNDWEVVRYNASNGLFKEAIIKAMNNKGKCAYIAYPRPDGKRITGCGDIQQCMVSEDPGIPRDPHARYQDFMVKRNGRDLGTLFELRQALEFRMAELDFYRQLNFSMKGGRRLAAEHALEGYHCVGSCLYRKIRKVDLPLHNPNLIIDLGDELNAVLAACAEPGYAIVMIDLRLLQNDGIPAPRGTKKQDLEAALHYGPDSFTTQFARTIAGFYGYSRGHAHIGPLGLTKGYGQRVWNHRDGCPFSSERPKRFRTASEIAESDGCKIWDNPREARQYYYNQKIRSDPTYHPRFGFVSQTPHDRLAHIRRDFPRSIWLDTSKVPAELSPPGSLITELEQIKIKHFQKHHLHGKIVHRPVPCTMADRLLSSPTPGQQPLQLAAADERVHQYDNQHGYNSHSQVSRLALSLWSKTFTLHDIVKEVAAGRASVREAKRSCIVALGYLHPEFEARIESLNMPNIPDEDLGVELPPAPDLTHVPAEFVPHPTPEQVAALDNWAEYMNHPLYPKFWLADGNMDDDAMDDEAMADAANEDGASQNMAGHNITDENMTDYNMTDHSTAGRALPIQQSHGLAGSPQTHEPLDSPSPFTSYLDPRLASDYPGTYLSTADNAAPAGSESPVSSERTAYLISMARDGLPLLPSVPEQNPALESAHSTAGTFLDDDAATSYSRMDTSTANRAGFEWTRPSASLAPASYLDRDSTAGQPNLHPFTAEGTAPSLANYSAFSRPFSYPDPTIGSMHNFTMGSASAPAQASYLANPHSFSYPDPIPSMHNFNMHTASPGDNLYLGSERSFGPAGDNPGRSAAPSYPPEHPSVPMDRRDSGYGTGCETAAKSQRGGRKQ